MNLRTVDLNLLVILDALLDEAHVSRAASRVGLTQPAASRALERCRHIFRDPLLERGRGTMRLTAQAEALRAPLKNLLADVAHLIDPPEVPLTDLRQTVRIVMSDHPASAVLTPLLERLRVTAPGISVIVQPWGGSDAVLQALLKGDVDLSLSVFGGDVPGLKRRHILDEYYVVLMRKGHPAASGFNLDRWLEHPHVLVSGRGDSRTILDQELARLGRQRQVGLVVPSFLLVPPLVAASDHVAMLPSRCVPDDADADFCVFEPPVPVEGFPLHLVWHARRDRDSGVQHVAQLIEELLR